MGKANGKVGPDPIPIQARFWSKVRVTSANDCWEWLAQRQNGYGVFRDGRMKKAHRVAWELVNEQIPVGLHVLHSCDNPGCVNPKHLFVGTHSDNMKDRQKKGRANDFHGRGESHGGAKLTEVDVKVIREMAGSASHRELGEFYGVSRSLIGQIINRKIWRHI